MPDSGLAPAAARSAAPYDLPPAAWTIAACVAVAVPSLLAFNLPPSATFFNQAAAFLGWGAWAWLMASSPLPVRDALRGPTLALLAALALLTASAVAAPLWAGLPWTLAGSAIGTLAAAALVVLVGAALARDGRASTAFHALCVALLVAGAVGAVIGAIQVFLPQWTDGQWIADIAGGRAAGNLRQPNHLSSLLLWSLVALVWLAERERIGRLATMLLGTLLLAGIVLTASRTGILGVLLLAAWGLLDKRMSRPGRARLLVSPIVFALLWVGLAAWAHQAHQAFGGDEQLAKGDISSSRFGIWANTLALIARHPWTGVGWGEFNFAWTLTPFPGRPVAFFDHTHNLPLQFAVELGLPLAALVLALLGWALWQAFRASGRCADAATASTLRAAFVMVLLMAVHSQLEYPLWYAYFLLPTAWLFGYGLGRPAAGSATATGPRALFIGGVLLVIGSVLAVADYARVVRIFAPPRGGSTLEQRIADGERSWFFAHHAAYAAATVDDGIAASDIAFQLAPHYLMDTRLMIAWSRALARAGELDKARHLAQRLREFRNPQADEFFDDCDAPSAASAPAFQCQPAQQPPLPLWRDYLR